MTNANDCPLEAALAHPLNGWAWEAAWGTQPQDEHCRARLAHLFGPLVCPACGEVHDGLCEAMEAAMRDDWQDDFNNPMSRHHY